MGKRRPCVGDGLGEPPTCQTHMGAWWANSNVCDLAHIEDGDEVAFLKAAVRKLRDERKTVHSMLTEAGIAEDVLHDGVRTCLIGRLGVALGRLDG